jgi:hypothetical protein
MRKLSFIIVLNVKIHRVAQGIRPVAYVLDLEGLFPDNLWLNSLIFLTLFICVEKASLPRWRETLIRSS